MDLTSRTARVKEYLKNTAKKFKGAARRLFQAVMRPLNVIAISSVSRGGALGRWDTLWDIWDNLKPREGYLCHGTEKLRRPKVPLGLIQGRMT
jgi:hypothetical protein